MGIGRKIRNIMLEIDYFIADTVTLFSGGSSIYCFSTGNVKEGILTGAVAVISQIMKYGCKQEFHTLDEFEKKFKIVDAEFEKKQSANYTLYTLDEVEKIEGVRSDLESKKRSRVPLDEQVEMYAHKIKY